ncbi:MAG: AMP-binding protein [Pannonibacter sp.]
MHQQPEYTRLGPVLPDGFHAGRLFADIERFGDATALICPDGSRVSYSALAELADTAARSIRPARALISAEMQNAVEPIAFYIGALRAGHVVIPNSGDHSVKTIREAFGLNASYANVKGDWTLTSFSRDQIDMSADLAVLLSTSGSTGSQKLVRLSHQNLLSNALAIAEYLELRPGERAITSLPAHYSFGLSILHSHLLFGHTLVLSERSVSEPEFWEVVERECVTSIAGVPHTYHLLELGGFLGREYPHLRYLTQAGGKLPPERARVFAQWAERSGKRFYIMYGQTEASPRIAYLPPADAAEHADCIGVAVPGGRLRIEPIDEISDLPSGAGELVYQGPNVMMGYAVSRADLARPQGPDEIRTGDIAVRNARGYYRIIGRLSRFAKLFGLRLSFDDIEQRLAAAGIPAAVSGDDTGIVVAATEAGSADRISRLLAHDLGIPASRICVAEVSEIPRLPSGKTDYQTIRRSRREAPPVPAASLAGAIALILACEDLDPALSFAELGGDSLNYVQMVLTLEEFLGYVPDDWENTPVEVLAALPRKPGRGGEAAETAGAPLSIHALDLARTLAIFLALATHTWTQVGFMMPADVLFLSRIATPMLIILFGVMVPLLYVQRAEMSEPREVFHGYLTKALQCYFLYAVNVFAFWLMTPSGWLYALGSLAFLGAMPYAQILVFYTLMFLLLPVILFALKRVNFWVLFSVSLAVHAAFVPLKMVPTPPSLAGQPILQRLLDLLVGAGAAPAVAGPSILHSFVLLLAGVWIGRCIKLSAEVSAPRRRYTRMLVPLIVIFAAGLLLSLSLPDYPVDWTSLANMQLRNLNHPAYIFVYGLIAVLVLSVFLLSGLTARTPRTLMTIGRRSLFGFGIGNAVIVLWPKDAFAGVPPLGEAGILLVFLVSLIYGFDYAMRAGRNGPRALRWVFQVTNWGGRVTGKISRQIVGALFAREAPADQRIAR